MQMLVNVRLALQFSTHARLACLLIEVMCAELWICGIACSMKNGVSLVPAGHMQVKDLLAAVFWHPLELLNVLLHLEGLPRQSLVGKA